MPIKPRPIGPSAKPPQLVKQEPSLDQWKKGGETDPQAAANADMGNIRKTVSVDDVPGKGEGTTK